VDFSPIAAHVVVRPVKVAFDVRVVVAAQRDHVSNAPELLEQMPSGRARGRKVLLAAHGAVDGGGAVAVDGDRVADFDGHAQGPRNWRCTRSGRRWPTSR